jgi:hypothetical protein
MERNLNPDMLVIADEKEPIALAGVMGGADSEVIDSTTSILLESANFNNVSIRRTSIKLNLQLFQAIHETAVGHSIHFRGGFNSDDPKASEISLAVAPVPVSIEQRFFHGLFGRPEVAAFSSPIAFGQPQRF